VGLVRDDQARELCFTGRIFQGDEAVALGVATRVCADPHAEALALAREIAGRNPHAIRAAKRLFAVAADGDPATILKAESVEQGALIGSPNQIEAAMSAMQKRPGVFADV
jgi:enoyl-CoA hydratase/carnithine racemase